MQKNKGLAIITGAIMKEPADGYIFNIASGVAKDGFSNGVIYGLTKFAKIFSEPFFIY